MYVHYLINVYKKWNFPHFGLKFQIGFLKFACCSDKVFKLFGMFDLINQQRVVFIFNAFEDLIEHSYQSDSQLDAVLHAPLSNHDLVFGYIGPVLYEPVVVIRFEVYLLIDRKNLPLFYEFWTNIRDLWAFNLFFKLFYQVASLKNLFYGFVEPFFYVLQFNFAFNSF